MRFEIRLSEFNIYLTVSYLGDLSATYTEYEFASHTDLGWLEMENRTVLNVADLPSGIRLGPTNPGDDPQRSMYPPAALGTSFRGSFFLERAPVRIVISESGPSSPSPRPRTKSSAPGNGRLDRALISAQK